MRKAPLIAALLVIAACATSRPPERQVVQHPPAEDFSRQSCPAEPAALSDAQLASPDAEAVEDAFDDDVLLAGRGCRDANARICRWHVERGMVLPAGIACGPVGSGTGRIDG